MLWGEMMRFAIQSFLKQTEQPLQSKADIFQNCGTQQLFTFEKSRICESEMY